MADQTVEDHVCCFIDYEARWDDTKLFRYTEDQADATTACCDGDINYDKVYLSTSVTKYD